MTLRRLAGRYAPAPVRRGVAKLRDAVRRRDESRRDGSRLAGMYDASYFGHGDTKDDGRSGYATYDRVSSNANIAAYLLWRFVPFSNSLDIGCAKGFLVEALGELGHDSYGCDISTAAIEGADPSVQPRLRIVDLESSKSRRKLEGEQYSLITMLEVLEHVRPDAVPDVLAFVRTIADGYVVATIPSLGRNKNGPGGFPNSKVLDHRLEYYQSLGDDYQGPIPEADLMRDAAGNPIEGHVTIASFDWWTDRFAEAGFVRVDDIEVAAHPVIGRYGLSMAWNFYVFHVADKAPPPSPTRSDIELATLERRWMLNELPFGVDSRDWTRSTFSDAAAIAIEAEYEAEQARHAALDAAR